LSKLYDVIIVGAGPAGIFTALELTRNRPDLKILIIEKGRELGKRVCEARERNAPCFNCSPCSTICGWGGAGAFSDGKLTLSTEVGGSLEQYISEKHLAELIDYIDRIYTDFGAPGQFYGLENEEEIEDMKRRAVLAELKLVPVRIRHMGTGRCKDVLQQMHDHLKSLGVEVRTSCQVEEIIVKENIARGLTCRDGKTVEARFVVLAPGREGAEWLNREARRIGLENTINPVDIGVRVELPSAVMEPLTRIFYEAKLIYYSRSFNDKVRTFCMNPNGEVVLENNDGLVTVNGHSHAFNKTENTNFAVLVSKTFTEPFKEPIAYGRYIASLANVLGGGVIIQSLGDLLSGHRSTVERLSKCMTIPTLIGSLTTSFFLSSVILCWSARASAMSLLLTEPKSLPPSPAFVLTTTVRLSRRTASSAASCRIFSSLMALACRRSASSFILPLDASLASPRGNR
jgi:uncharacterized FAD-dependent dehydrogenase